MPLSEPQNPAYWTRMITEFLSSSVNTGRGPFPRWVGWAVPIFSRTIKGERVIKGAVVDIKPPFGQSIVRVYVINTSWCHQQLNHSVGASTCNRILAAVPTSYLLSRGFFWSKNLMPKVKVLNANASPRSANLSYRRTIQQRSEWCQLVLQRFETSLYTGVKGGREDESEPTCAIASKRTSFLKVKRLPHPSVGRTPSHPASDLDLPLKASKNADLMKAYFTPGSKRWTHLSAFHRESIVHALTDV